MKIENKKALIEFSRRNNCTLNGQKAVISGAQLDSGYICDMNGHSEEFAWGTIECIMAEKNGKFKS